MTVARQEMERDNLDYTSLEIIITSLLAVLFTENCEVFYGGTYASYCHKAWWGQSCIG